MGTFIAPFLQAVLIVLEVLEWLIFAWVILSWILFFLRNSKFRWRHRRFYSAVEQLNDLFTKMTQPLLRPFRRLLRRWDTRGIDWSPLLLLLAILILRGLIAALYGAILLE